jgi:enamine deaminase RidA (YjgF/YER057c/UK114 family)
VRRLLVSGTASIEPGGKTVWQGDIAKQIDLTMEVVEAILRSRGMGFADITRANAYCKRPEYLPYFRAWQQAHGAVAMPALPIHCDICRDDLLFEIEVDARREG